LPETESDFLPVPQVRGIITFAAPHRGLLFARLDPGPIFRTLYPNGPAIRELETTENSLGLELGVRKLAVYSPVDNMVMPIDCLKTASPGWDMLELPGLSHLGMLWHPSSIKAFESAFHSVINCGLST
jgi:hypothetical protein